ncbi:MAG: hypothetical protein IJ254_02375 [Succinivibrio sp.]|nr:hypothetical protein [Succinivibrio sp.]
MICAILKKVNGDPIIIELDESSRKQWASFIDKGSLKEFSYIQFSKYPSFSVFYCNDKKLALNAEIRPKFDIGISSIKVYGDCILFNSDIDGNPINLDVASRILLDVMFNMHV